MNSNENLHEKHRERMLVKLKEHPESLSEHELLEILLYSVVKRQDTNPLAHKILRYFKDLNSVFSANVEDLLKIDGVGPAIARHIKTTGMILAHTKNFTPSKNVIKLNSVAKLKEFLKDDYTNLGTEVFTVLFLSKSYDLLSKQTYTSEEFDKILVNSKDVVKAISINRPSFAVIAHNHPSGIIQPSATDNATTAKLHILLSINDVCLFDHLIFGRNVTCECFSYHLSGSLTHIKQNCNIDALVSKNIENI